MNTATHREVEISVSDEDLDDLRRRLGRTRFPDVVDEGDESGGISVARMRELVGHWTDRYDWRLHEAELNRLDHRMARIDGEELHYVSYPASPAPSGRPILLLHGWPDSFLRYTELAPLLAARGHEVIVPSLPGYGLSPQPRGGASVEAGASLIARLMDELGHDRYAIHGGDWGAVIAEQIAVERPEAVVALHLSEVPVPHLFEVDRADAGDAERTFLEGIDAWSEKSTYFSVQSQDPTTLSYGLADSPLGLAGWIADKYWAWSDREPNADALITQISLYWHTNTIRSSMRLYAEGLGEWGDAGDESWEEADADAGEWSAGSIETPTAFALFPADIGLPPRELAERFFAVERFTVMPSGGHFGALEEPQALADDIATFLADLVD